MKTQWRFLAACAVVALALGGCYEDVSPPPQPQAAKSAPVHPAGEFVGQGGGAALGGAKRAAQNIVDQAETASARTGSEGDPETAETPAADDDE